jgi:hypothetical protein
MRHQHPISTVFGGSFAAESREAPHAPRQRKDHSFGPLAILLIGSLLGATIPAVAITANNHVRSIEAAHWKAPPSLPIVGFEKTLY